jgi:predicted phosphodiesterase
MRRISNLTTLAPFICAALLWWDRPLAAQTVRGQWDFDAGNLSATVGLPMEYFGGTTASKTQFGTTASFGISSIAGQVASVMSFPACLPGEGYVLHTNAPGNGGGAYINQYTLIIDLLYPTASNNAWRALFQTSRTNANDADFFVGDGATSPNPNGIGINGQYNGSIQPNTWYRVAVTVDLTTLAMAKYINGALVGTQTLPDSLDGRWSLYSTNTAPDWLLLFADESNETKAGYVNSIQFRDYAMSAFELAQLGGPTAGGIPIPATPTDLHLTSPNGGERWPAGSFQTLSWTVSDPTGILNIDLYDGEILRTRLGQTLMTAGQFAWQISPYLGDSTNYRITVSAAAYPAVTDSSDAPFEVYGSTPEPTTITKLPMLQDYRTDAMNLLWETNTYGGPHAVDFGINDVSENVITGVFTQQLDATHFIHTATIQPLQTETVYQYRVRSGTAASPVFTLRSGPRRATPIKTVWFADEHTPSIFQQQVPHMAARHPDLVLASGDLMNDGGSIDQWQSHWFAPLQIDNLAQTTPVFFSRGNHDGEGAYAYAYTVMPGNEAWFAFTYGDVRFIFLDTNLQNDTQTAWLAQELASPQAQSAQFRVLSFHMPPYTDMWDNSGFYNGEPWVRDHWVPLFEQYNVDLVVSGHNHDYLRGSHNGVTYLIVGGAGNVLDTVTWYNWGFFVVEAPIYHYGLMQVDRNTLTWNTYDINDNLYDTFQLTSRTPLAPADFDADGDVDADDLALLQACAAGPNTVPPPGCSLQDLDADSDVDQSDFGLLQRCFAGPNQPASPNCGQ